MSRPVNETRRRVPILTSRSLRRLGWGLSTSPRRISILGIVIPQTIILFRDSENNRVPPMTPESLVATPLPTIDEIKEAPTRVRPHGSDPEDQLAAALGALGRRSLGQARESHAQRRRQSA